jgi:hypothetical protein
MSALATLKLVVAKKPTQLSPIVQRRNKVAKRIYEQIQLATARKDGISFAPTKLRTVTDAETGESKTIAVPKRMKEWWFVTDSGKLCVQVKYGAKTLVLGSKSQSAVELANADQLIPTLEVLKAAVEAGELDAQLEAISGATKAGFKK